jgi:hypothetical protein
MHWMNIRTELLRTPDFANAKKGAIETWLRVLAYCCEQENGGRLAGACEWTDRAWMMTCGVTKSEVEDSKPLLYDDAVDWFVAEYPVDKEAEVQAKREGGRVGGRMSALSRASIIASSSVSTEGKGMEVESEVEVNEKKNGKNPGYTVPVCFERIEGFTAALGGWIEARKKKKNPPTGHAIQLLINRLAEQPGRAVAAINEAIERGWATVKWEWMDNLTFGQGGRPKTSGPNEKESEAAKQKYGW